MAALRPGLGWRESVARVDYAFQPIVNIHTGVTYGYEVLLRNVAAAGFDSIAGFFDQAHQTQSLNTVHQALFHKAVDKLASLPWAHQTKLFFNLDSRVFGTETFNADIDIRLPQGLGLSKDTVCLEISEKHELCGTDDLQAKLDRLRRMGCRIAVDDFGTGFSGLHLLYFARPECAKIDPATFRTSKKMRASACWPRALSTLLT